MCPNWNECDKFKCHDEKVCLNGDYWAEFHKLKAIIGKTTGVLHIPKPKEVLQLKPSGKCFYCERDIYAVPKSSKKYLMKTRDHIIPLSKGGVNLKINMVDACQRCNSLKADRMPEQFAFHLGCLLNEGGHPNISNNTLITILYNTRQLIFDIAPRRDDLIRQKPTKPDFDIIDMPQPYKHHVEIEPQALKSVDKDGKDWWEQFVKRHYSNPVNFHEPE